MIIAEHHPARASLLGQVLDGLRHQPKSVSSLFLYDTIGSHLFERICELPEYYLTRTEIDILRTHAGDIGRVIGDDALLIELGSGSSIKTRLLLDALQNLTAYVPVDISRSALMGASRALALAYPAIEVMPVCADFTQPFPIPSSVRRPSKRVAFFPGSTIGNFDTRTAQRLLSLLRRITGSGGGLLIGVDLVKNPEVLERAYQDSQGVTAEFNLNLLSRLNREFGANFDPQTFNHRALWQERDCRIEMHLVSTTDQTVCIGGEYIAFARGESICTELCHKYTLAQFGAMARQSGWEAGDVWMDAAQRFSVHYLHATD
jgi:L-histidine Nalpha-methyltransferase